MIDPEFWSDETVGKWSSEAKLFYIALWNFSDDKGRFKAHPYLLKSQIFPYNSEVDVEALKDEIGDKVLWYMDSGSQYGFVRNFLKYQRIDKPSPSRLPAPQETVVEDSSNTQGTLPPNISKEKRSKYFVDLVTRWNVIPGIKPVKRVTGGLETRVASRLREYPDQAWWDALFAQVAASDWLSGRNRQGWCATLDWVLGPKNLEKILAGNYDNRSNPQARPDRVPT